MGLDDVERVSPQHQGGGIGMVSAKFSFLHDVWDDDLIIIVIVVVVDFSFFQKTVCCGVW